MQPAALPVISHEQFQLIGKLLALQHPELAHKLITDHSFIPHETDLSIIPCYFHAFLQAQGSSQENYESLPFKSETRRMFVACMLHIYNHSVFTQPKGCLILRRGLSIRIAETLGTTRNVVSAMIRDVIVMHKAYDSFRKRIEFLVDQLKTKEVA